MTIEQFEELRYIIDLIDCERDLMSGRIDPPGEGTQRYSG
jgi:hypothetical protein